MSDVQRYLNITGSITSRRNRQEVGGTKALAEAFCQIGTLESIEMPQNGMLLEGEAYSVYSIEFLFLDFY